MKAWPDSGKAIDWSKSNDFAWCGSMPPRCEIHTFLQRAEEGYSCIVCPYGMLVLCVGAVGGMAWLIDARGIGTVFLYSVSVRYSCLVCRHGWGDGMAY